MKAKDWIESEVVVSLNEKHDIKIIGGSIYCLYGERAKCDIGNKSKGKIDFLTEYCGYRLLWVDEFPKR